MTFLYDLHIFVLIQHSCKSNTVSSFDPQGQCYKEFVMYIAFNIVPSLHSGCRFVRV